MRKFVGPQWGQLPIASKCWDFISWRMSWYSKYKGVDHLPWFRRILPIKSMPFRTVFFFFVCQLGNRHHHLVIEEKSTGRLCMDSWESNMFLFFFPWNCWNSPCSSRGLFNYFAPGILLEFSQHSRGFCPESCSAGICMLSFITNGITIPVIHTSTSHKK